MTLEVIGKLLLLIVAPWTIVVLWMVMHALSPAEQVAGLETVEAAAMGKIGAPLPQILSVKSLDGSTHAVSVADVPKDPDVVLDAGACWRKIRGAGLFWLAGMLVLGFATGSFFVLFGQDKMKSRQIRGQVTEGKAGLIKQVVDFNRHESKRLGVTDFSPPMIAGVPYPFRTEMEHTMIVGAPGSGKSQAIHQLIESIRSKGQRAIIFDPELDYIRHHYNAKTDIILNPFDERSPGWSPFYDAKDTPDWVKLSRAIFKDPKSGDPYWVNVARSLFSWTGYQLMEQQRASKQEATLTQALDYLFGSPKKLQSLLAGTPAAMHLNGLEGARVSSLISVLAEGVEPLIYLHGAKGRFSIRNWVNGKPGIDGVTPTKPGEIEGAPPNGFLFLSAPESHMDALRPLLGFWSELAVSALLSRHGMRRETTWFVLDEFHSAGRVDALADGPQRLRKYGGAVVLGFQQISQLHDLYGPDKAKTIIGQCQTKLILRAGDFETATLMSEQLGRRVMRRVDENTSYGANSIRDGVGLIPKEELEPIFLPEDVQNFSKFEGVVRVSNARPDQPFPIALVKLEYVDRPLVAEGFQPCDSDPVREYLTSVQQRAAAARDPKSPDNGGGTQSEDPRGGIPVDPNPSPKPNGPSNGGLGKIVAPRVQEPLDSVAAPTAPTLAVVSSTVEPTLLPTVKKHRGDSAASRSPAKIPPGGPSAPENTMDRNGVAANRTGAEPYQPATVAVDEDVESGGSEEDIALNGAVDDEAVVNERLSDKVLEAKPEDLSNLETNRRKRRQEEDEREWERRDAIVRGEPFEQRAFSSVYQRELALERTLESQTEYLGGLDQITKAEVLYAEGHQHAALGEAGALLFDVVVGSNVPVETALLIEPGRPELDQDGLSERESGASTDSGAAEETVARAAANSDRAQHDDAPDTEPDVDELALILAPTTIDLPVQSYRDHAGHPHSRMEHEEAQTDRERDDRETDFEIELGR